MDVMHKSAHAAAPGCAAWQVRSRPMLPRRRAPPAALAFALVCALPAQAAQADSSCHVPEGPLRAVGGQAAQAVAGQLRGLTPGGSAASANPPGGADALDVAAGGGDQVAAVWRTGTQVLAGRVGSPLGFGAAAVLSAAAEPRPVFAGRAFAGYASADRPRLARLDAAGALVDTVLLGQAGDDLAGLADTPGVGAWALLRRGNAALAQRVPAAGAPDPPIALAGADLSDGAIRLAGDGSRAWAVFTATFSGPGAVRAIRLDAGGAAPAVTITTSARLAFAASSGFAAAARDGRLLAVYSRRAAGGRADLFARRVSTSGAGAVQQLTSTGDRDEWVEDLEWTTSVALASAARGREQTKAVRTGRSVPLRTVVARIGASGEADMRNVSGATREVFDSHVARAGGRIFVTWEEELLPEDSADDVSRLRGRRLAPSPAQPIRTVGDCVSEPGDGEG